MKKTAIVLAVLAALFLGLSAASASTSVSRAEDAIAALSEVHFDEETREKLDTAIAYYDGLDTNIHLDQKVANIDALEAAKQEYVRLAIQTAVVMDQRKAADGHTDAETAAAVEAAREAADTYCPSPECEEIDNYADLVALEAKYTAEPASGTVPDADSAAAPADEGGEEIELC